MLFGIVVCVVLMVCCLILSFVVYVVSLFSAVCRLRGASGFEVACGLFVVIADGVFVYWWVFMVVLC